MKINLDQWKWTEKGNYLVKGSGVESDMFFVSNEFIGFYIYPNDNYYRSSNVLIANDCKEIRQLYDQLYSDKDISFPLDQKEQAKKFIDDFLEIVKYYGVFV